MYTPGPAANVMVLSITVPEPAVLSHNFRVPFVWELTTMPNSVPFPVAIAWDVVPLRYFDGYMYVCNGLNLYTSSDV